MPKPKVIFKDKKGRFVSPMDRYGRRVDKAYRLVRGKYRSVYDRFEAHGENLKPEYLAEVLPPKEFESLPDIIEPIKSVRPKGEHQLWNLAKKIDELPDVRGKLLEFEIVLQDGRRILREKMNYAISLEGPANYKIFEAVVRFLMKKKLTTKDRTDPLFMRVIDTQTDYGKKLFTFLSQSRQIDKLKRRKIREVKIKNIKVSEVL